MTNDDVRLMTDGQMQIARKYFNHMKRKYEPWHIIKK